MGFKRIAIIVLLGLLLLAIVAGVSYTIFYKGAAEGDPVGALPASAVVVYKGKYPIEELKNLFGSDVWQILKESSQSVASAEADVYFIDSLLQEHKEALDALLNHSFLLSLHSSGANELGLLLLAPAAEKFTSKDLERILISKDDKSATVVGHSFEGIVVNEVRKQNGNLSYSFFNGLIAISRSTVLVEDAIRTANGRSAADEEVAGMVRQVSEGQELVLNHKRLDNLLAPVLNGNGRNEAMRFMQYGSAARYDWKVSKQKITLYGTVLAGDTGKFLAMLKDQKPQKPELPAILPPRTAVYIDICFSDFRSYFENNNVTEKNFTNNVREDFLPLMDNEAVLAITEPSDADFAGDWIGLLKSTDPEEMLNRFLNFSGNKNEGDYRGQKIVSLDGDLPEILLGRWWRPLNKGFVSSFKNYIVFASDKNNLQRLLDELAAGQGLGKNLEYRQFMEEFSSVSSVMVYVNPSRSLLLPQEFLDDGPLFTFKGNYALYRRFRHFGYQLTSNADKFYNQVTLTSGTEKVQQTELVWRSRLDTVVVAGPYVVKNHNNNSNEIVVFDAKNQMYLLSSSGKVLWKRNLDGLPKSDPVQIDLYQNDKLQYLFTTEKYVYLIDRNGEDVANYPIRLGGQALQGFTVEDPFNNRTYRYFIHTENNRIYGYNGEGRPMQGWNPKQLSAEVTSPVKFFEQDGKHTVAALTSEGSLGIWDLNGQVLRIIDLRSSFSQPLYMQQSAKPGEMLFFSGDTAGSVHISNLAGQTKKLRFGFGNGYMLTAADLDEDGKQDILVQEQNAMFTFTTDSTLINSVIFSAKPAHVPKPVIIGGTKRFLYYSRETGKLYLTELDGIAVEGFPLAAAGLGLVTDLNKDGIAEIIVPEAEGALSVYKLR